MRQFRRINTDDYDLTRVQDAVEEVLNPISTLALLDGVLIENIVLSNSSSGHSVDHGLGRKPRLWLIVRKNANADVWELTSSLPSKTIQLRASAACTVSLWVG